MSDLVLVLMSIVLIAMSVVLTTLVFSLFNNKTKNPDKPVVPEPIQVVPVSASGKGTVTSGSIKKPVKPVAAKPVVKKPIVKKETVKKPVIKKVVEKPVEPVVKPKRVYNRKPKE